MNITIHASFLPHNDPDASLAFYRDILGFDVRTDVGSGKMRWITVGPPGQPDTSILLAPPATDPGTTDDERRIIAEMMAKGTYGWILLATKDLDGTFERLQASDAEVVQRASDAAVRHPRLRFPRSRGQLDSHPRTALSQRNRHGRFAGRATGGDPGVLHGAGVAGRRGWCAVSLRNQLVRGSCRACVAQWAAKVSKTCRAWRLSSLVTSRRSCAA